eukprot:m.121112 g.121112  ORF g.121112 m.121112 type:complete len:128 (+) comp19610_c1_seq4:909-1292(+)
MSDTLVNVPFLCSGMEFQPPSGDETRPRSRSQNQRLNDFYEKTLKAAEGARTQLEKQTKQPAPTTERREPPVTPPTSIVNLDFLRSGQEFTPAPSSPRSYEDRKRRDQKLNEFHDRMLAAAASAKRT